MEVSMARVGKIKYPNPYAMNQGTHICLILFDSVILDSVWRYTKEQQLTIHTYWNK